MEREERSRFGTSKALDRAVALGIPDSALAEASDLLDHNEFGLAADRVAEAALGVDDPQLWALLASVAVDLNMVDDAARWISLAASYPCACCGHLVFGTGPGSYEICPICFWEDDALQLRRPDYAGGANRPSLIESQRTYQSLGAMEARFRAVVRPATAHEPGDPLWRPFDPERDRMDDSAGSRGSWPDDLTTLYWWRPTYWLAGPADLGLPS